MGIQKVIIQIEEDGTLFLSDAIEHEGKLWLVTAWLQGPTPGTECPERIICLDGLPRQKAPAQYKADWILNTPMRRSVLEGRAIEQGLVVIERPDIHLRVGTDYLS